MPYPILVLHGWGSCAQRWWKVKELLENRGYRVFIPDLPGFGENPEPSQPWGTDEYAEWVKDFTEKNNLDRFFLLGHSFGGGVAIKYAVKYPQNIEKLFLIAAAYFRRKTLKLALFKSIAAIFKIFSFLPFYNLARKAFYKFIVKKSDYFNLKEGSVMKEIYLRVIKEDLSDSLPLIQPPTIIIWGEKDRVTPVKSAYLANKEIKNSKLIIIKNGDHDLERKTPEILSQKIIEFLK